MNNRSTLARIAPVIGGFCLINFSANSAVASDEAGMGVGGFPRTISSESLFSERNTDFRFAYLNAQESSERTQERKSGAMSARERWQERLQVWREKRKARLEAMASKRKSKQSAKTSSAKPKQQKTQKVGLDGLIAKYAKENGVPYNLARAVVQVESTFRPNVTGGAGEIGLMQIKLATARGMGYKGSRKALYNPATNLFWGMKYLGKAHRLAGGSTCGTILRYNAGHGAKSMNPISSRYCSKVRRIIG